MDEIRTKNSGEASVEVKVGRPPYFTSPEELEEACNKYFIDAKEKNEKLTVTGLALALGFATKQSIYDYAEKEEFTYPLKRSLLRIENNYEQRLTENNVTGAIFALKNFGWKDKTEVENSGSMTINWNEQKTYETK